MSYLAPTLLLAGYLIVMMASPVRSSMLDGWRCVRRYPVIWRLLALLGFAHALFHFAVRLVLHFELAPEFTWVRAGWHDPSLWLSGSPDSLWWLPAPMVRQVIRDSALPVAESLAGLFNNSITTFPLAVIAAFGLIVNRHRYASLLRGSLRRRFGLAAWPLLACVYLGAMAVVAKAALYFLLPVMANPDWFRWAPVVVAIAAAFEYLVGVGIQIYLIMHAYAWVRGLSFEPEALREVAVRRLGAGAKWAGIVILLSSIFIELPLVLKNFPAFTGIFPDARETVELRVTLARIGLAAVLLSCASMQAWLALHGETLRRAWRAHWRLLRLHWWKFLWFLIVAGMHLFAVQVLRGTVLRGLGENTAPGLAWTLLWPWINGLVAGWCLASWICLFKRCER
jgi:hypothetical protein